MSSLGKRDQSKGDHVDRCGSSYKLARSLQVAKSVVHHARNTCHADQHGSNVGQCGYGSIYLSFRQFGDLHKRRHERADAKADRGDRTKQLGRIHAGQIGLGQQFECADHHKQTGREL